ncbi:beta-ketoacyl-ACP reductase [Thermodesulfobacteriota bacterium]
MRGKNSLITGASRGIGKAIALALAEKGSNIIVNDIAPARERAEKTVAEIKALGVECYAVFADVSDFEACREMAAEIEKQSKTVHILVNNAGITKDKTLRKMPPEAWHAVIDVNLNSLYNVTHNILPLIPDNGRIIGISSVSGLSGNFGQANYAATKAGMIGFTKTLSKELGKQKITVNAIAPGFIKSEMTDKIPPEILKLSLELVPSKEIGQPEDVAGLAVFLASDRAGYISGQVIRVDGGMIF